MTTIDLERSLGEIVTDHPGAAPVFERLGLDYCCHGDRSLGDAATSAGLDPAEVAGAVITSDEQVAAGGLAGSDYASLAPAELADHIEATHHAYLHAELPRLIDLTAKIAAVHGDRHPELIEVARVTVELCDDLEPHMRREELVLFPMIRSLATGEGEVPMTHCGGGLQHPIARMVAEHENTGEILGRLRQLTNGYEVPADGCATYRAAYEGLERVERDTHLHIHKENNVLFPAATRLTRSAG
jgi:regulator of cell morphogenesis and NO signaling